MARSRIDGPEGRRSGRRLERTRFHLAGRVVAAIVVALWTPWTPLSAVTARGDEEPPPSAEASYAGRPVADVLRDLESRGLTLLFTSELVPPDLVVAAEPEAREPREVLEEVLAPHALAVREGPGGVLVVVVRPEAPSDPTPPAVRGEVHPRGARSGLPGATVRVAGTGIEVMVGPDGSFSIPELPPGVHTFEASAEGYLEAQLPGTVPTAEGAGRPRVPPPLVFELLPLPFVEDEIVVRSSRVGLLDERPSSLLALGRDEIERLPHLGGDLLRAASLLPGVASNDVSAELRVRGGRADEVAILLDGQELYDAFHLKDYDNALSVVGADLLAGASLSTGGWGAEHGDRMGGVLDLTTAEPPEGRRFLLGLGTLTARGLAAGRFAEDRGHWLASARRGSLALAERAIGDEESHFWDAFAKAELDTRAGLLSIRFLAADDELEVDKTDEDGFERLDNGYRSSYAWITHQGLAGPRVLVETRASVSTLRRDRGGTGTEEEGSFALDDRRDLDVLAAAQRWDWQLGSGHLLRWSAGARRYEAFFDYDRVLDREVLIVSPELPSTPAVTRFAGELTGEHVELWASDRLTRGRLTAEVGLRHDRHEATDEELTSPRVALAWRLGERSVLRGAWGRFHQSQRPHELEVEDGESRLHEAELTEETVLGYEALVERGGLDSVRLELYRRDVDDPRPRYVNLIEPLNLLPEIEPDRVRIAPLASRAEGVELLLRGRIGPRLGWWVAYTWASVEDRLAFATVPRALDQRHAATLDLDLRLPARWNLNLAWRFHTGWPTTPISVVRLPPGAPGEALRPAAEEEDDGDDGEADEEGEELALRFGRPYSERFADYHRLDVRASREWPLRLGRLTFHVDVQNLYDRRNPAGFDASIDEDQGTLDLEKEPWPGIFPSLGVTWRF